ncbi:hypothetical protein PHYSODRAFT_342269 [Phytophthora sojae]|uniref:Uncharacterized protein n=1 Tax=Phytophthora sojae (strain P6497) TaxID=1094619 RepID=G5AFR4_PHYSP|nr:hypothetical protein PHYSODRAFT_342269 [Phytophthora sojae]EGZ05430.1 hypothetical protein PHYSODRAFT_342269 [Phytophthora sojae]|eukprot:XP_009538961.1 hypothetical protein PHYSODRAFT_342269 [Phytophthora sojae]
MADVFQINERTILIGVFTLNGNAPSISSSTKSYWEQALGSDEWIIDPPSEEERAGSQQRHPCFDWYGHDNVNAQQPTWWTTVRQQLDRLQLAVYEAPKGWQRDGVLHVPKWTSFRFAVDEYLENDPRLRFHPNRVREFIDERGLEHLEEMQ